MENLHFMIITWLSKSNQGKSRKSDSSSSCFPFAIQSWWTELMVSVPLVSQTLEVSFGVGRWLKCNKCQVCHTQSLSSNGHLWALTLDLYGVTKHETPWYWFFSYFISLHFGVGLGLESACVLDKYFLHLPKNILLSADVWYNYVAQNGLSLCKWN